MVNYNRVYALLLTTVLIALCSLFSVNFVTVLIQKNSTSTTTSTTSRRTVPNTSIANVTSPSVWNDSISLSSVRAQAAKVTNLTVMDQWEQRRLFVRAMTREAWDAYVQHAWANDSLPSTESDKYGSNSGHSIVAALSTLWLMNMTDEFAHARSWIKRELDLSKVNRSLEAFDIIPTYLGSLLSSYALTNDALFLYKAKEIELLLRPVFNSSTGN